MYMELDGQGPRYAQLIRSLKSAILEARLAPGSRVPASRNLANELGISRNTVLAAYEQLQAEGFLHARVGSGSYVADIGNRLPTPPRLGAVPVAPLSDYARRALNASDGAFVPGHEHKGLRYNLQYGVPLTNPALASAWRREINRAVERAEFDYPDAQGLPALREQICDYLARRRGVAASADDVLVMSFGEFGRTPVAQGADGRDHNPHGFTMWLAGGGSKPGTAYGATDDYGYYAAVDKVHIHDLHATVLHLLGLNHLKLTYRYAGRDFRLTDIAGEVVKGLIA